MNNKSVALFFFLVCLGLATNVRGEKIFYGYCAYEEPKDRTAIGYEEEPSHLGAAAFFTDDFLAPYSGGKVIGIRVAVLHDIDANVFVKKSFKEEALRKEQIRLIRGWNEVLFATPLEIDGKGLVVGYDFDNLKEKNVIGVQSFGKAREHGIYISQYGGDFVKYSNGYGSNLMVQLILEVSQERARNLMYVNYIESDEYLRKGTSLKATFSATNYGVNPIENVTIRYRYADGEQQTRVIETPSFSSGTESKWVVEITTPTHSGELVCEVIACNGVALREPFPYSQHIYSYNKSFSRKILQEQFGTERSTLTPYAQTDLNYALPGYTDKVVWVQHHVGFNEDKFTHPGSRELLFLFGNPATYNPAMMLNRRIMKGPYTVPTFAIPWSERIQELYEEELSRPAFVSLAIDGDWNRESGLLNVTLSGEAVLEEVSQDQCRATILVIENNIATNTQAGVEQLQLKEYVHQHTIREFVSSFTGEPLVWKGDTYSLSKQIVISKEWKPEDVVIVAFIAKPFNKDNLADCEVFNAEEKALPNFPLSVCSDWQKDFSFVVEDGKIVPQGDYLSIVVYNSLGQRVVNENLACGGYVVKVTTATGKSHIAKVFINK